MDVPTRVAGIPCIARVTYYFVQEPDSRACNPDDFYGFTDINYDICDQRGRHAPWLERKATDADCERICNDIETAIQQERATC